MVKKHWILGHLNDVIDSLVAGVSVNSGEDDASGNFFILKTSAISKGKLNLSEKKPVLPREVARLKCSLRQETILISRMNTPELVGECAYVPCDDPRIYLPDRIWQTNFKKDVDVSAKWLNYLLSSKEYRSLIQNCATGTSNSMKNISKEQLLGLEILYPSFREQTSIAKALSDVDSLISSLQELIEKKKAIKQGAMQELLTGKKRLPGFSGKRKRKKLGNYIKFEVGFPFKSQYFNSQHIGLRLIKNRDLKSDDQVYYTTEDVSSEYIVNNGDVLVGMDGDFTPCIWRKGVALLNQRVGRIGAFGMDLLFSYYLLQQPLQELQIGTGATTVKHLSHFDVEELELTFPEEIKEQQAIAQVLSDMDSEIEQLEKKLAKYQQIKQGMMQELLTGRIRLV